VRTILDILLFYYYHWVGTSAGGLSVVSVSASTKIVYKIYLSFSIFSSRDKGNFGHKTQNKDKQNNNNNNKKTKKQQHRKLNG